MCRRHVCCSAASRTAQQLHCRTDSSGLRHKSRDVIFLILPASVVHTKSKSLCRMIPPACLTGDQYGMDRCPCRVLCASCMQKFMKCVPFEHSEQREAACRRPHYLFVVFVQQTNTAPNVSLALSAKTIIVFRSTHRRSNTSQAASSTTC